MSRPYEGDVSVQECWSQLAGDPETFLIDVRTTAEWTYVGFPLVPDGARPPIFAEWQTYPSMSVDASFAGRVRSAIEAAGGTTRSPLFFLCRSGARSMGSAAAMTADGFEHCFNIVAGFEGPPDGEGHRGREAGWKAEGLPWAQK